MTKRLPIIALALTAAFVVSGAALPQEPKVNVGDRHGNMKAAQEMIRQAWFKVDEAQKDNNYNLGGHAGRAKELLSEASSEIKQAAETANHH